MRADPPAVTARGRLAFPVTRSAERGPAVPHTLLIQAVQSLPQFPALLDALPRAGDSLAIEGLAGSAPAIVVGGLHRARPERIWLIVAPTPEAAEYVHADLETILGEGSVSLFPQRES